MIIVEGSDLVGKTTFCKALAQSEVGLHLGAVYQHLSRLPDKFERVRGYRDLMSVAQVRDRFHMSEVVYSQMRSQLADTTLTDSKYRLVDAMHTLHAGVTVLVVDWTPDRELIRSRFNRPEMYTLDQCVQCNDIFCAIASYGAWGKFKQMNVDYVIKCTRDKPFPDESDIRLVCDLWLTRLDTLHQVGGPRSVPEPLSI